MNMRRQFLGKIIRRGRHPVLLTVNGKRVRTTEYLNQLYFDALVFTPEAQRHLAAQVGAGQIMLGSDYPLSMGDASG